MHIGSSARQSELSFDDAIDATQPSVSTRSNKENRCPVRQPLPASSRPTRIPQPTTPTTPRTRKQAGTGTKRTDGVIELSYGVDRVKTTVKRKLKLDFDIDDWQAHLIQKLLERYDAICIAGTGYGKSVLFEGVAAMSKRKIVIVICPLKILEKDQVKQATEKGLRAIYLNEDNSKDPSVWRDLPRGVFNLIYLAPEMLLSPRFLNLMLDPHFREMIAMLAIDEGHLVEEWGDDFRVQYKNIHLLRTHTGQHVPFLTVTATATTKTFSTIWDSLAYGCRPFWGIDVGCERPNLQYMCRTVTDSSSPILDILNLLPNILDENTQAGDIPKVLVFRTTREECCDIVRDLRRVLPPHLRPYIHAFYASLSEQGKDLRWEQYCAGGIRFMIATVAASVGCNARDIDWVVNYGITESLSGLAQRFGRAGRDPSMTARCAALVPSWAIRPPPETTNPALARVRGTSDKVKKEAKRDTTRREKLDPDLEQFVNIATPGYDNKDSCAHTFMRSTFRPDTGLDVYNGLDASLPSKRGARSKNMQFVSRWTVLDLKEKPKSDQCCHAKHCNPTMLDALKPADKDDPRLRKYNTDFISLRIDRNTTMDDTRPTSALSDASDSSSSSFIMKKSGRTSREEKMLLAERLIEWRETLCTPAYGQHVVPEMLLPDNTIKKVLEKSYIFLHEENHTRNVLSKVVEWNLALDEHFTGLFTVLQAWRRDVLASREPTTPTKGKQPNKRAKTMDQPKTPFADAMNRQSPIPFTPHSNDLSGNLPVYQDTQSRSTPPSASGSSTRTSPSRIPVRSGNRFKPYNTPQTQSRPSKQADIPVQNGDIFSSFATSYKNQAKTATVAEIAKQRLKASQSMQSPNGIRPTGHSKSATKTLSQPTPLRAVMDFSDLTTHSTPPPTPSEYLPASLKTGDVSTAYTLPSQPSPSLRWMPMNTVSARQRKKK